MTPSIAFASPSLVVSNMDQIYLEFSDYFTLVNNPSSQINNQYFSQKRDKATGIRIVNREDPP